jgi:hypothetical protein
VAVFGTPGSGDLEWEMTGRHLTIRADGNSVANAAFAGPSIYAHGTGDSQKGLPGNVFYYQTKKASERNSRHLDRGEPSFRLLAVSWST